MEYDGKIFISANYTKQRFINLNLTTSSEKNWIEGIEIFEDRIKGRYLNIIQEIIDKGNSHIDGFCVMALNCLLIETLLQFKKGWKTTKGCNKEAYSNFLYKEFRYIFPEKSLAERFYKDIRCGILHSAETTNGSQLTIRQNKAISIINEEGSISVDVIKIYEALVEYVNNYIRILMNNNNKRERSCFLKKMRYICEIDE